MYSGDESAGDPGIGMNDDGHAGDLAGPHVLEACPAEARAVAEHARDCPNCAAELADLAEVVGWLGAATSRAPASGLRERVLSAALAARPPNDVEARRLADLYRSQTVQLDELLRGLSTPQWLLAPAPHRSIRDLVVHLYGNDEFVATVAGIETAPIDRYSSTSDVRAGWRRQALAVADAVTPTLLDRPVRLAGRALLRRPLREALIQRGFETWIHAEDVRAAVGRPPLPPSGQQIADIIRFALGLLPAAMDAAGRARPSAAIRAVLTGPGGGTRVVELSATGPRPGTVVAEVRLPAERFCRLLAGRLTGSSAGAGITGEPGVAADFLAVAATMGCD